MGNELFGKFTTKLEVKKVAEGKWELENPLIFESKVVGGTITVPPGFVTDFASVPRIPFAYLLAGGEFEEAATIHDYLYQKGLFTRESADSVLAEACLATGQPGWRRFIVWLGVRLFGWAYYKGEK